MVDLASFILRCALGLIFIGHGLQKAFAMFGGSGLEKFSAFLSGLGFVPAYFWAVVATCVELIGGICLLFGFFTRVSSFLLLVLIVVAGIKVHLANGFLYRQGDLNTIFSLPLRVWCF